MTLNTYINIVVTRMYRLCFPLTIDNEFKIAIFPSECGFVNNSWWHRHLKQEFESVLDALALAEDMINAKNEKRPCPCGENCKEKTEGKGIIFTEEELEEIHLD